MIENATQPEQVVVEIRRALRWLVIATVVLYLALAGLAVWTWSVGNGNRDALCALRADLEGRVASSQQFLREHPNGIPGISAKFIQDGIVNQQRTILALSGIDCGKPPAAKQ